MGGAILWTGSVFGVTGTSSELGLNFQSMQGQLCTYFELISVQTRGKQGLEQNSTQTQNQCIPTWTKRIFGRCKTRTTLVDSKRKKILWLLRYDAVMGCKNTSNEIYRKYEPQKYVKFFGSETVDAAEWIDKWL